MEKRIERSGLDEQEPLVRLFVYGTLLPGFAGYRLLEPYLRGTPLPGRVRGRLVDAGAYPALVPATGGEDRFVRGLWCELSGAALAEIDAYEEFYGIEETNDYERVWVRDADRPDCAGWTYIWPDSRGLAFADFDAWADKYQDGSGV